MMSRNPLTTIKYENTLSVYKTIISHGKISRADIADKTELSIMTVGKIVDAFLTGGLIVQVKETRSSAGRRVGIVEPNGLYSYLVIDVSGMDFRAVHYNAFGVVIGNFSYIYNSGYSFIENTMIFLNNVCVFYKTHNIFDTAVIIPLDKRMVSADEEEDGFDIEYMTGQTIKNFINPCNVVYTNFMDASVRYYRNLYPGNFLYIKLGLNADGVYVFDDRPIAPSNINNIILNSRKRLGGRLFEKIDVDSLADDIAILLNNYVAILAPHHIIIGTGGNIKTDVFREELTKKLSLYLSDAPPITVTNENEPHFLGAYELLHERRLENYIKLCEQEN